MRKNEQSTERNCEKVTNKERPNMSRNVILENIGAKNPIEN